MYLDVYGNRTIPMRRPEGHKPPVQRYSLGWPSPVHTVVSTYVGLQARRHDRAAEAAFFAQLRAAFGEPDGPGAFELMRSVDEEGFVNSVAVAYWTDPVAHQRWQARSALSAWFAEDARLRDGPGYWWETFSTPHERYETHYSYPDYRIGLGRVDGAEFQKIVLNGYFGAMRDRIPLSAIDPLDTPCDTVPEPLPADSQGRRLRVMLPVNLAVIRSGQYWADAGPEQHGDYTQNLQVKLMAGMNHLKDNKQATGCLTMRMMFNLDEEGRERDESSVLSYFLSLRHMEAWSHSHHTHLDIYHHALAMMRKHREKREVRTWHEVFVLPAHQCFDYVNCHPQTGVLTLLGRDAFEVRPAGPPPGRSSIAADAAFAERDARPLEAETA